MLRNIIRYGSRLILFALLSACLCGKAEAAPADVLVVGDTRLKPVQEVVAGIEETMGMRVPVYSPGEAHDKLPALVKKHSARTVIALGRNPIQESLTLPASIHVLYALVILPPDIHRPNTTGVYMGTPISEYVKMVAAYLPGLKKISVIASPRVLKALGNDTPPRITAYQANTVYDFVKTVKQLDSPDALLLLPDISLLTRTALEETFLFSFRNKVPLLGISKKHVRHGALFALEFDTRHIGKRLGKMAMESLQGNLQQKKAVPSQQFNLYVNKGTAEKMGISIPDKMLKIAVAVYP